MYNDFGWAAMKVFGNFQVFENALYSNFNSTFAFLSFDGALIFDIILRFKSFFPILTLLIFIWQKKKIPGWNNNLIFTCTNVLHCPVLGMFFESRINFRVLCLEPCNWKVLFEEEFENPIKSKILKRLIKYNFCSWFNNFQWFKTYFNQFKHFIRNR